MSELKKISILGTVGAPARYGGFETLVENLVQYHAMQLQNCPLTVYCSSQAYSFRNPSYLSARLRYIPLCANGPQSVFYDIWSLFSAVWHRSDVILLLGVSGAIALPLIRLISSAKIITNIDGIEWKRKKWRGFAKSFLRASEKIAVYASHEVITDNGAIREYVYETYGVNSHMIAYGGDHAVTSQQDESGGELAMEKPYAFSVCRIEPENNIDIILEAFSKLGYLELLSNLECSTLVLVGNWSSSEYGLLLRQKYSGFSNLYLLDPIYDLRKLKHLRSKMSVYIHGHSAGGTNPSLVEAMHFGKPILAYDCSFNRNTTENKAHFFNSVEELIHLMLTIDEQEVAKVGREMLEVANRCYTWEVVARQYFSLIGVLNPVSNNEQCSHLVPANSEVETIEL